MPMFPLGTVLFPSALLPLHVFEPRYRALAKDCMAGDRQFGVVLIARGSEVGGGDVRTDVGCLARVMEANELRDGRWVLAAVGVRRLRVLRWLPDDPYPLADVEDWDDEAAGAGLGDRLGEVVGLLRRVLGLKAELGEPAARATVELADDPVLASYQVAALAPFGPADHQRLLTAPGPDPRLAVLHELLTEEATYLEQRLAGG